MITNPKWEETLRIMQNSFDETALPDIVYTGTEPVLYYGDPQSYNVSTSQPDLIPGMAKTLKAQLLRIQTKTTLPFVVRSEEILHDCGSPFFKSILINGNLRIRCRMLYDIHINSYVCVYDILLSHGILQGALAGKDAPMYMGIHPKLDEIIAEHLRKEN